MLDPLAEPSGDMLRAALDYGEQGLRIFPTFEIDAGTGRCACADPDCASPGKHPRIKGWQQHATDDAATLGAWWARWPNAGIAMVTGPTNGIVVADFDDVAGAHSYAELEAAHGPLPFTAVAITGRGRHLFFRCDSSCTLRNTVAFLPGVDRRAAGGYVCVAPTLHESGRRYRWAPGRGLGVPLAPVPAWLDEPRSANSAYVLPSDRYQRAALEGELVRLRAAKEGSRNDTLNTSAFNLGQLVAGGVLDGAHVRAELFAAALSVGLKAREVVNTIESGIAGGMKKPRGVPERPERPHVNGAEQPAADSGEPPWRPTVADPLSGLPQLTRLALRSRDRYLELARLKIDYVWQDILVAGTIGVVAGAPGSGKTTLVYLYAAARARKAGGPLVLLGREVYPAHRTQRLVIIEAEHSEPSAARKLLASLQLLRIDDAVLEGERVLTVARKAVTLGSAAWDEVVQLMAAGLVSDLIVDTVARFAPADANAEAEQVAIYDQVAQALESAPKSEVPAPTCLLVAHTRKGAASDDLEGVSGSTQRVGQADTVLLAEATREGGRVLSTRVTVVKLREDPGERWPAPQSFSIADGELHQALAPSRGDAKAADVQSYKLDADAHELAELVLANPGLGTRELRKVVYEALGWGNSRYERIENRLREGVQGVRLVNRAADPKKREWFVERVEPSTHYSEVDP